MLKFVEWVSSGKTYVYTDMSSSKMRLGYIEKDIFFPNDNMGFNLTWLKEIIAFLDSKESQASTGSQK